MKDNRISNYHWEKYWASSRCLLSCSYWGLFYTNILATQFGKGFTTTLIISKQGYSTCYFDKDDRYNFGNFRVSQMRKKWPENVELLISELKQHADALMSLAHTLSQKNITGSEWNRFIQQFLGYIGLHISPRNIIDYVTPHEVEQVRDILAEARLYTEPVYEKTEQFVATVAEQISDRTGYLPAHILSCLKEEIEQYFMDGSLPDKQLLATRHAGCALW